MLKALLIALLGMIIGPAIVTICLFYVVHGFIAGEPLDGGGWASVGIFGGLAMVLVLIGVHAWRSDRRAAQDPHAPPSPDRKVTAIVPYLMILGVLAGGGLGYLMSNGRLEHLAAIDRMDCDAVFADTAAPADCAQIARACRHSDLDLKEVDFPGGVAPEGVWPQGMRQPPMKETRARMLCIYRKTH